ncbi:hypothetical protein CsatA_009677 [Cannabis sativa]
MDIADKPKRSFWYLNEYGQLVEQGIDYEWLSVQCKHCLGYGHIVADCRKKDKQLESDKGRKKAEKIDMSRDKDLGSQVNENQAAIQGNVDAATRETNRGTLQPVTPMNSEMESTQTMVERDGLNSNKDGWKSPKAKLRGSGSTKKRDDCRTQVLRNSFDLLMENQGYSNGVEGSNLFCC